MHQNLESICESETQGKKRTLSNAGALQSGGGEFRGIFTPFYTINFRGLCKTGGARAPAAPPSSAPMRILISFTKCIQQNRSHVSHE